jgi:hypothetical protein
VKIQRPVKEAISLLALERNDEIDYPKIATPAQL